jgi:hypothetical protein
VPRSQQQLASGAVALVPAAAAADDADVFYDATEGQGAVLEAMLRELKQAQAARQEANRCVGHRVVGQVLAVRRHVASLL